MALNHIDLNIIPMEEEEYVHQQNANIMPNLPDLNINIGEGIDLTPFQICTYLRYLWKKILKTPLVSNKIITLFIPYLFVSS